MRCQVTRRKNLETSTWSGGETTQLLLHPRNSSYATRDFEVRISSATVLLDQSTFTSLPGYQRILMPLDAPMRLEYRDHGVVDLQPFDVADFDGGWETVSYGKCTDIGIMLAPGWTGTLTPVGSGVIRIGSGFSGINLLAESASVVVRCEQDSYTAELFVGDFLLVESDHDTLLMLYSDESPAAILASVKMK